MRFIQHLFAALSMSFVAMAANASPASPISGTDFKVLEKAQPADSGKKVEVIEFFWYSCPHCSAFEPTLSDWVKKQGDNIVFKRVPVAFAERMMPEQRFYYALEAMGKSEEFQKKIFNAIHGERQRLDNDAAILDYVVRNGIDRTKFSDLYNSFSMQSKLKRAVQMQEAYKVDGVPMLAIDGRYITSPSIVATGLGNVPEPVLHGGTVQVLDWLVAKVAKERKP
jgi:thiol:disulfide interchange protein DsbA